MAGVCAKLISQNEIESKFQFLDLVSMVTLGIYVCRVEVDAQPLASH